MDIKNFKASSYYYGLIEVLYGLYFLFITFLCLKGFLQGQEPAAMFVGFIVMVIAGAIVRFVLRLIVGMFKGLGQWSDDKAQG